MVYRPEPAGTSAELDGGQRWPPDVTHPVHDWLIQSRQSGRRGRHRSGSGSGTPAVAVVLLADQYSARAGDTVSFVAWIINDSQEAFSHIAVTYLSLTNSNLEELAFVAPPTLNELDIASLAPGESARIRFLYVIQSADVVAGGRISCTMHVRRPPVPGQ